jgi:transposase
VGDRAHHRAARRAGDRRLVHRHRDPAGRAKTDRLDARALAKLLWAGELDGVWAPDERIRAMRRRLARRAQLVRARSRAKNEIHAVLMRCLRTARRRRISWVSRAGPG